MAEVSTTGVMASLAGQPTSARRLGSEISDVLGFILTSNGVVDSLLVV